MYKAMGCICLMTALCSILKQDIFLVDAEYKKMILGRDHSYTGQEASLYSYYVLAITQRDYRGMCAHSCLSYSHECLSFLYNKRLQSCMLLKCHLSEKLVNNSTSSAGWEYWKNLAVCDEGWLPFAGQCFYYRAAKETWASAKDFCKRRDSSLIEINSHEETMWISDSFLLPESGVEDRCPKFYDCGIWMGATNHDYPGEFVWIQTGNDMLFPEWGTGQPNNVGGDQNCVILMRNRTGNDVSCIMRFEFVCEKEYNI